MTIVIRDLTAGVSDSLDSLSICGTHAPYAAFADNLKRLRTEANVTPAELASAVKLTEQSINRYEKGFTKPRSQHLAAIADFLSVRRNRRIKPDDILAGQ